MDDASKPIVELVAQACRVLGKLELTHGAFGHVSFRRGDSETLLIKGKGPDEVGLRYTRPDDIIEVDFKAEMVSGAAGLQPPSESFLHTWLYKLNPEVRSVVHVHPEHAVLLTICDIDVVPIYGAYGPGARLAIEGVPTYQRSVTISNNQLGQEFAEFMGSSKTALMRGHGVSVVGSGIQDAVARTLALNELVTMTYKAHLLGGVRPIEPEDVAFFQAPLESGRRRGSVGGEAGVRAAGRYYCSLAGEDTRD